MPIYQSKPALYLSRAYHRTEQLEASDSRTLTVQGSEGVTG